jgi:L-arabinose isomerase
VTPGVICTVTEATEAVNRFREVQIDALLVVHIMWSEDQPLLEVLRHCQDTPVLLWNYHPTGNLPARLTVNDLFRLSGTVGMLQGSAPFERLGLTVHVVSGTPDDPDLTQRLREYSTALRIRKAFRGMRAARIAGRCEVMTGTYVNAESLRKRLGVELVEIDAAEYASCCEAVENDRVDAFQERVTREAAGIDVSAESLRLACRNTLALDDLVVQHDLGAVVIQDLDVELHRMAGIRPCLCPPVSAARGIAFGMESDLNTTLGMLVAMKACSAPCMYTEIFTYDPRENMLLMGHAGVHDPRLAGADGVTIVRDEEYCHVDRCEGAWQEFILAPGPVTCVSLYDAGTTYRMTVFEGESVGPPRRLQGFAHAMVRPELPVETLLSTFVRRGMTQHFAIAPGRIGTVLEKWCRLSGVDFHWEKAGCSQ